MRKFKIILIFFAIFFSVLFFTKSSLAEIIPTDRRVTWQGNVGVAGGIPARMTICSTLGVAGQAPTYAQSVTTSQITSAISSCTPGQTVYLNPGTYTLNQSVVMSSNVTLRGAGPTQTILKATSPFGNYQGLIKFANCSWPYEYSAINVISGYTKGSTQIVVADASTISIGDIIRIDELNDASVPVSQVGDNGTCSWCDPHTAQNGSRIRMQILKVTNKVGNTLTVEIPLYWTFSAGNNPQVWKPICTITSNAGVEDLQLWNASSGDNNSAFLWGTDSCWLKNVKTINAGQYGLYIYSYNYRTEIRQCELTGYVATTDDTYTLIVNECSAVLVEDNISHDTGSSVIMGWGASGNVFAYNYAINTHRTYNQTGWFWPDAWEHSSHTGFNLYEGNVGTALAFDATWGSHSNNTVFRNRYTSKNLDISYLSSVQGAVAFAAMAKSSSMNVIGNILGSSGWSNHYERSAEAFNPGGEKNIYELGLWAPLGSGGPNDTPTTRSTLLRHGNYDYYNNSQKWCDDVGEPGCQGGDASHTLPASLYLTSKPAWFGTVPWPPAGPDVAGLTNKIPAQLRYEAMTGGDTTPPAVSITAPTSGSTVSGSISVSANASDNIGVAGVQFKLDGVNLGAEDTSSPYSISWDTTGVANGSHTLTAVARDASNNQTTSSGITVTVSNAADTQAPSTPTNLTATAVSSSQINLSWTASTDNVGVTGYRVERCQGSGCSNFTQIATPSGTSYSDTGLSASTAYSYRIRATDAAGNLSSYSSTASATTSSAPPPSGGLVAAYSFNEGLGTTAFDSSGNNNNGTLINGPLWTTGKYGNAISFDGANDYISLANDPVSTNTVTACAWMYPKVLNEWRMIIGNARFFFGLNNVNNSLALFSDSSSHGAIYSANNSISLNVWQYICGVRLSDGTTSIYINGIQSGASGNSGTPVAGFGLALGAADVYSDYTFNGLIDNVRIYNRVLSQSEIQSDMNTPIGIDTTPPAAPSGVVVS